jgi:ferritin-like metal-binding protein YciE
MATTAKPKTKAGRNSRVNPVTNRSSLKPSTRPEKPGGPFEDNFDSSVMDLFTSELKDMLWAENHLLVALPKMIDASDGALKKALQNHLKETKNHVSRLEEVFELMGKPALAKKCDAMEGLTIGGEHVIENTVPASPGRKLGVIGSGLKVENFEITCYKALIQMATTLKMDQAASLFEQNLQEEFNAAEKLQALTEQNSKK